MYVYIIILNLLLMQLFDTQKLDEYLKVHVYKIM